MKYTLNSEEKATQNIAKNDKSGFKCRNGI